MRVGRSLTLLANAADWLLDAYKLQQMREDRRLGWLGLETMVMLVCGGAESKAAECSTGRPSDLEAWRADA